MSAIFSAQMDTREQPNYLSYLLRLYRVNGEDNPVWRISLDSSLTGERKTFADCDDLFAYLMKQMKGSSGLDEDRQASSVNAR